MANEISIEVLAQAWQKAGLKMTSRRYRQIAAEGKAPIPVNGIIDGFKALTSIAIYYQALAAGSGSLSLTDEKTRLTKINADMKNLTLLERMKKLVNYESTLRVAEAYCLKVVGWIDNLPNLAARLEHQRATDIQKMLEEYGREGRIELSAVDFSRILMATSSSTAKAKAKTNRKSVGRRKKGIGVKQRGARELEKQQNAIFG